jgi:hypothetical protein
VLTGSGPVRYVLEAYCAQFEKDNPSDETSFTLEPADLALECILRMSSALSTASRQAAVWIYTDHVTYAHLNEKFSVKESEWTAARAVVERCQASTEKRPAPSPRRTGPRPGDSSHGGE